MPSNQRHDSERPAFPFKVGDVVRWSGKRCKIGQIDIQIKLTMPDGTYKWTVPSELTDAPDPDQDQVAALGKFLCNPQVVLRGAE